MRKQQIKLLERGNKHNLTDKQMAFLSREDLTIKELETVFRYFLWQKAKADPDMIVHETEKCISYLQQNKEKIESKDDYETLLNIFLPFDDYLSEQQKKNIFKMYLFVKCHTEQSIRNYDLYDILTSYNFMIKNCFLTWHISLWIRLALNGNNAVKLLPLKFSQYPCLMDNYLHHGKGSLFYYLAENGLVDEFKPDEKVLLKLYDTTTHSFKFQHDKFGDYFSIDYDQWGHSRYVINSLIMAEFYPLITRIKDFCNSHDIKPLNGERGLFGTFSKSWLNNPSDQDKIQSCYDILGQGFRTNMKSYRLSVTINNSFFVSIRYSAYKVICVDACYEKKWRAESIFRDYNFTVFPDGRLFQKFKETNKYYPLSMWKFMQFSNSSQILNGFMNLVLDYHASQNPLYNDVFRDFSETKAVMPLSFNEIRHYRSRKELLLKKYKIPADLHIKWNKKNLNLSYLLIKTYRIVNPGKSQQMLLQEENQDISFITKGNYSGRASERPFEYVKQFLIKRIYEHNQQDVSLIKEKYRKELADEVSTEILPDEYEQWIEERVSDELNIERTVEDYVSMCRQSKIKIRLDICTKNQLEKLHDKIVDTPEYYRDKTGPVKVPKDSKFLALRDILPPEFEWIKTRKRLILETELQHHCVWSYASQISADSCAIYSFTDKRADYSNDGMPRRYTIEFRQSKIGLYYVEQVQGKYDRANANGMKEYIQSLLDHYISVNKKYSA